MKIHNIDTAISKEYYQVFIPDNVAKTIDVQYDDGYGSYYGSSLGEGFYTARCYHNIHAIGAPKYWEIEVSAHIGNSPGSDSKDIKGIRIKDLKEILKEIMGV